MTDDPQKLRQQARQIVDDLSNMDNPQEQSALAARAFELAQRAEIIERMQWKATIDSNVKRIIEQLYAERDHNQRQTFRRQLIREEKFYGLKQQRLDKLNDLLRDCDDRFLRLSEKLNGGSTEAEKTLLENILYTRQLLRDVLHKELARPDSMF